MNYWNTEPFPVPQQYKQFINSMKFKKVYSTCSAYFYNSIYSKENGLLHFTLTVLNKMVCIYLLQLQLVISYKCCEDMKSYSVWLDRASIVGSWCTWIYKWLSFFRFLVSGINIDSGNTKINCVEWPGFSRLHIVK